MTLAPGRSITLNLTAIAVLLAGLALIPRLVNGYMLHILTIALYFTILASSWSLLSAFTGQFSLAHQGFAAVGAYTTGLLTHYYGIPIPVGIAAGTAVAALMGLGLGRMVLRMQAIYLAIATWAFAETIRIMLTAAYKVTRGELGLNVPPLFKTLDPTAYYYAFLLLTTICVGIMWTIVRSPIGYFMRAIKDDELRASSLGVDTTRIKIFVFSVSSAFAGLAGAFYAHYVSVLSPSIADFTVMAKIIIMVIVGGMGTFTGPLIGGPLVQVVSEMLQRYGEWNSAIFALLVIVLMRTYQGGIVGLGRQLGRSLRPRETVGKPALPS